MLAILEKLVNNCEGGRITVTGRQTGDEVQGDERPWPMRNRQLAGGSCVDC